MAQDLCIAWGHGTLVLSSSPVRYIFSSKQPGVTGRSRFCGCFPGEIFFHELDTDKDGRVTLDDVKKALRKRNLPPHYAKDFMNRVRRNRWWLSSFG